MQLATFGRLLTGEPAAILGFRQSLLEIGDPEVVRTSGKSHHPIVSASADPGDTVAGTVFLVSAEELARADRYEVSDYRRVRAKLDIGGEAWVYVAAVSPDA